MGKGGSNVSGRASGYEWAKSRGLPAAARSLVAFALMMIAAPVLAESPRQLLGKTVVIGWNEYREQRCDDGQLKRGHTSSSLLVYVSENGRLFTRLSRRGARGGSNSNDLDPEGGNQRSGTGSASNLNASFDGAVLAIQNSMQSGARRIQATFNGGFTGCSVSVRFGREGGSEIRHRTMDGKMCNIISTDVSGNACSIRNGNLVGGG